jgi:hypothetical protein
MSAIGAAARFIQSPTGIVIGAGIALVVAWPNIKAFFQGTGTSAPAQNPATSWTGQQGTCAFANSYTPAASIACSPLTLAGASGSFSAWSCTQPIATNAQGVTDTDPLVGKTGVIFADRFTRPNASRSAGNIPASNQTTEVSGSIQNISKKPFQAGWYGGYATAYNESKPDPSYTISLLAQNPRVNLKGK